MKANKASESPGGVARGPPGSEHRDWGLKDAGPKGVNSYVGPQESGQIRKGVSDVAGGGRAVGRFTRATIYRRHDGGRLKLCGFGYLKGACASAETGMLGGPTSALLWKCGPVAGGGLMASRTEPYTSQL